METHKEKSVPSVKDYQIQGSWVPETPVKAPNSQFQPINENAELEAFFSRYAHQNQNPQNLVSYTITSAQNNNCMPMIPNQNYLWDEGRINLQRDDIEMQKRGLENYLPNWNSQGRRTKVYYPPSNPQQIPSTSTAQNDYPYLSSWESSNWKNCGNLMENDPLNSLSFGELLGGMGNGSIYPAWNPNLGNVSSLNGSSMYCNQNNSHRFNQQISDQQIRDIFGREMQNCASLHPYQQIVSDTNSLPTTKHSIATNSTFVPATPDSRWRINSDVVPPHGTQHQGQTEQNEFQEQDVAAAMVNLQNGIEEAPVPFTDSSSGKVSMAVENHISDKGGDQIIDLNKTPQKKTRRRRYQPKVLSEKKPRKTPKPKTPKPNEPKESTGAKRKYARKSKVSTDETPATPPAETTEAAETKSSGAADKGDTIEVTEANNEEPMKAAAKSCKRSLNFDLNGVAAENNFAPTIKVDAYAEPSNSHAAGNQYNIHLGGEELTGETRVGMAYDLNRNLTQQLENYLSLPTKDDLVHSQPDQNSLSKRKENDPHTLSGNTAEFDAHLAQSPNSSPCASSSEQQQRGKKRSNASITNVEAGVVAAGLCQFWQPNQTLSVNANTGELPKYLLPEICKKKRTEKVQRSHVPSTSLTVAPTADVNQVADTQSLPRVDPSTLAYYCGNPGPFAVNAGINNNHTNVLMDNIQNNFQLSSAWTDLTSLKKKRSKGTTRVRDVAQLMGIAPVRAKPGPKGPRKKIDVSGNVDGEALVVDCTAKPKPKRRSRKESSESEQWGLVLYDASRVTKKATGSFPALPWTKPSSVEEITRKMKQLYIVDRKSSKTRRRKKNAIVPYHANNQEQNALVLYERDGSIVPFEGPFKPLRKRRERAKVDLDDETNKVWRLLLENIDNKGVDGTDEEKAKWWENERCVFRGRVDSFIARMRLVQGDRRFTPWKGSVLDSVIGVFLTQNVSDHLSSSAFMSLAARFPLKSEGSESTLSEESTTALVVEPDICIIERAESISWNEKPVDQQVLSRNSRRINDIDHSEEKEVVNSKELAARAPGLGSLKDDFCESSQKASNNSVVSNANSQTTESEAASVLGNDRAKDDATLSQQPIISSQNSTNSPNLQQVGMSNLFSESDSRTQLLTNSTQSSYFDSNSFLGLLKMAENLLSHESYGQTQNDPLDCTNHVTEGSPESKGVYSSNYLFNLDCQLPDIKGIEMLEVDSKTSDTSKKDENCTPTEQSNITIQSTVQNHVQEKSSDSIAGNTSSCYVLDGEKMIMHSQSVQEPSGTVASSVNRQMSSDWKSPNSTNYSLSHVTADVTESTVELKRESHDRKEVEKISAQVHTSDGISDLIDANANKTKKGKAGKGKADAFDWDSLRREAQVNGKIRGNTPNTRDSLDWEAVRHAHVSQIAETIKERGMNNMLAERIKALLDRLVKEHGSINMEWLRDIPPDKAKEYLLSFRGLGLKSVECVRLLTLHHLAFPVDTNVGRIAVRLGWVPLQPLPESLQLHLLEMYPILESIQKYLWPRLCKLDQKTLYELHYHLITFGKVFCTKRQPNCNACPLRGECRHFASAFASARFALPGTEEKGIVPSNGGASTNADPVARIDLLPLPPLSNLHSHRNPTCVDVPRIESPYSPLALPLAQTINHLEGQYKVTNCEPIVEVPASPEQEPEQEQTLCDIEDTLYEDPDEIPTIQLNMKEFSQTLQNYMNGTSNALVALTPEAASLPTPKLKNISRLRTEHHVYELPDTHPLLEGMDKREPDDPCSYLLAIWTPGETPESIQPPERRCNSEDPSMLCNDETCSYCNSLREANSQIVRGTLLIPCRTAMRGSFPLNGTYFQVNEVFADHNSSLSPIAVPRSWLWNLPRRTVYFGTSIPTIFRGLNTEDIQHCFWRGFVCVRGFDQKTRAPRPLMARLHFPASRMTKGAKGRTYDDE
ncbi:unnamed protein product [Amaranthus hypochondriacus]